ncbi:MAG: glycerophosphodiester phosphodiesterase [Nitrososphaerota archaeon]|nr:glycerophosphodiester phosphodiesterase [Nitrososphaerota archaeon]
MVELTVSGRPMVVAHRGASGRLPENTFASFELAAEVKADMIELDIHPSKDGTLVVMHDETVDRTTDGSGRISEMTLEEIKRLNAAAKSSHGRSEPVPTFAEVLGRFSGRMPLAVEVKHGSSMYPGVEKMVVDELRSHGAEDKVELISFDLDCLLNLKREEPSLKTGFIFIGNMASSADMVRGRVDALHGRWNFVTRQQVDYAKKLGFPTFVWTVDTSADIREALDLGADGVVSNFPERAFDVIGKVDA